MSYNVLLLDEELRDGGLPIEGVSSNGTIWWIGTPTQQQLDSANTILAAHNPNGVSAEQQKQSFVDAMQPILRDWHMGTITTSQALNAAALVLDNHPNHKSVMNTMVWPATRLVVNPAANVALANIAGNANAETAYWLALLEYATRVQTWRE